MKIKVINPNTSVEMTERIGETAIQNSREETNITYTCPEKGPVSIEGLYDEALAVAGVLEEVQKGEKKEGGFDAYVLACFGDPGLLECREITEAPVIGIAESSILFASQLGYKFSIITVLERIEAMMEETVKQVGMESRCASIRCTDVTVLDLEENRDQAKETLLEMGKNAVEKDGAEVLCLGCAGMSGLDEELQKELGVPVIDPVVAGVKMAEAIVDQGKKTSKIKTFKHPEKKRFKGYSDLMQP